MGEFKDLIGNIIHEQLHGPGTKSGHGLARKSAINQEPPTEPRPHAAMGGGMGGFGQAGQAGQAAGGMRPGSEPSDNEAEFQKDIEKMDDPQPLTPKSPLGALIAKAFGHEVDPDAAKDSEEEEKGSEEDEDEAEVESMGTTNFSQHESMLLRTTIKGIIEDYKGEEEVVTDDSGEEIDVPDDEWQKAQKTEPTMVQQMDEPFNVETKEGPAKGEEGDYLAKGVEGEMWPIDQEIFDKTHKIVSDTHAVNKEGAPGFGVGATGDSVPSYHTAMALHARESVRETVATNWQRNRIAKDVHLEKEAKRDKSLSHTGNIKGMGVPASTPDGHSELDQDELDAIDASWKDILKFSNHAFKSKPLPLGMRFVERFLEKKGVCAKHSMQVAGIIAKFFGQTDHPTSMVIPKAIPRITQEPNVKGSGHFFGGHPGPFHPV